MRRTDTLDRVMFLAVLLVGALVLCSPTVAHAADSQSIASEIEILKSKVEIAKAQSDVASKRFETLGKEASQAREKTLEDIKGLDRTVEELNKLN